MSEFLIGLNLPAILVGTLMVVAAFAYILRDWERIMALVAAVTTGVIGVALWRHSRFTPTCFRRWSLPS
jgi:hypothetical protein